MGRRGSGLPARVVSIVSRKLGLARDVRWQGRMTVCGARWSPPHCPNPDCNSHVNPEAWRFKRKGFYRRRGRGAAVQRYLCRDCDRSFSSRSFSPGYWLRRPGLLRPIFFRLNACSGLRQIAREFGVSPSTIQRYAERLGRHCLLLHERLRPTGAPREAVVLDGFRTLESGHYWPFDLNLVVGRSHFVYGFQDSELRRSGRMRPGQRRHRTRLEAMYGRPNAHATRRAVAELVGRIVPEGTEAEIHSDDHAEYPRAFARLRARSIHQRTTSGTAPRSARNPLFPVNLADLLLRHGGANHKRETIAFSKRRQGALYRAAIWTVWRNYMQWSSERRRTPPPGVRIGAIDRRMRAVEVLGERLFPWRIGLRGWLRRCYFGEIPTRRLGSRCRRHTLRYAV